MTPPLDPSPLVTVLICTYNRPHLLVQALRACLDHATRRGLAYELLVVDNSPEGFAAPLVAAEMAPQAAAQGVPLRVVPAAPPNISVARNAGIAASEAPYVAFLDDDLLPEPGWLDALLETARTTGADIVAGPVFPVFSSGPARDRATSPLAGRCWWCWRLLEASSGTQIRIDGPGRTRAITVGTSNTFWRRDTTLTDPVPFDPALGGCGGEDKDLLVRLEARGRRVVWCAEAWVGEIIEDSRLALRYQILRAFGSTQGHIAAVVRNDPRPRRRLALEMAKALLQIAVFLVLLPLALVLPDRWRRVLVLRVAFNLGKLFWWRQLGVYQMEGSTSAPSTPPHEDPPHEDPAR